MQFYTVVSGDTLKGISTKFFGDSSRYMDIAEANDISNPNLISVGMRLRIPDNHMLIKDWQLKEIVPNISEDSLSRYIDPLNDRMEEFSINTPLRVAHFIAQVAHESGAFNYTRENLNYSANALRSVFSKYFKTQEQAEQYARKPEQIASRVYANRMGNGDEASKEGWLYRGRGLIQLTGRDNYKRCGDDLDENLVENPDKVASDPYFAVVAATWYWQNRNINRAADNDDVKEVTRLINGGYHGLTDRKEYLERAKNVLLS